MHKWLIAHVSLLNGELTGTIIPAVDSRFATRSP